MGIGSHEANALGNAQPVNKDQPLIQNQVIIISEWHRIISLPEVSVSPLLGLVRIRLNQQPSSAWARGEESC